MTSQCRKISAGVSVTYGRSLAKRKWNRRHNQWSSFTEQFERIFRNKPLKAVLYLNKVAVPPVQDRYRVIREYQEAAIGGHRGKKLVTLRSHCPRLFYEVLHTNTCKERYCKRSGTRSYWQDHLLLRTTGSPRYRPGNSLSKQLIRRICQDLSHWQVLLYSIPSTEPRRYRTHAPYSHGILEKLNRL